MAAMRARGITLHMPLRYVEMLPRTRTRALVARIRHRKGVAVADMLVRLVLICAVLGAFWSAMASSGVGRMRHKDALELRRQQRFRYVSERNANAPWLFQHEMPDTAAPAREPVGTPTCSACGALAGWEGGAPG